MTTPAIRITAIQERLNSEHMSEAERVRLTREKSEIWEREYKDAPYDLIARDVWLLRY